jgi:hypothetical protein
MAMECPRAWIIRVELDHHVSEGRHILRISTLGIFRVDDRDAIPLARAIVQHPHVVAMKVHGLSVLR